MDGVQNLRKAILENKRRAEAAEHGSKKRNYFMHVTQNYLYRWEFSFLRKKKLKNYQQSWLRTNKFSYGALIAFAS